MIFSIRGMRCQTHTDTRLSYAHNDDDVAKKVFQIFITFPAQFVTTTAEGETGEFSHICRGLSSKLLLRVARVSCARLMEPCVEQRASYN